MCAAVETHYRLTLVEVPITTGQLGNSEFLQLIKHLSRRMDVGRGLALAPLAEF